MDTTLLTLFHDSVSISCWFFVLIAICQSLLCLQNSLKYMYMYKPGWTFGFNNNVLDSSPNKSQGTAQPLIQSAEVNIGTTTCNMC